MQFQAAKRLHLIILLLSLGCGFPVSAADDEAGKTAKGEEQAGKKEAGKEQAGKEQAGKEQEPGQQVPDKPLEQIPDVSPDSIKVDEGRSHAGLAPINNEELAETAGIDAFTSAAPGEAVEIPDSDEFATEKNKELMFFDQGPTQKLDPLEKRNEALENFLREGRQVKL